MAKKNELPAITVRLGEELDTFLEEYARKHGLSKSGVMTHLVRELYEQEEERELNRNLKRVEYELKRKALEAENGTAYPLTKTKNGKARNGKAKVRLLNAKPRNGE